MPGSFACALTLAVFNGPPVSAETSRATPAMPRQSPRFGVTAISNNQSSWLVPGSRSEVSDSTSMPAMVSSSASFSGATLSVTNSFSQLKVNFMRMKYWSVGVLEYWIGNLLLHHSTTPLKHSFLPELPEKPQVVLEEQPNIVDAVDRKSTRLNSSHQIISYAVFCL